VPERFQFPALPRQPVSAVGPLALAALARRFARGSESVGWGFGDANGVPEFGRIPAGVSGSIAGLWCSGCNRIGTAGTSRASAQAQGNIGFRGGFEGGVRRGVGGGLRRSRWPGSARAFQPEPSLPAQGTDTSVPGFGVSEIWGRSGAGRRCQSPARPASRAADGSAQGPLALAALARRFVRGSEGGLRGTAKAQAARAAHSRRPAACSVRGSESGLRGTAKAQAAGAAHSRRPAACSVRGSESVSFGIVSFPASPS